MSFEAGLFMAGMREVGRTRRWVSVSLDTADDYTFSIALEIFHGPIDLLLHLVKQNELPIEKLSLAQVANQYLICLERMRRLDLEVAGEYLVVAATLLSIKASTL